MKELHTGVILLETEGGFLKEKNETIMCVVPNKEYYLFKETILAIDANAFIVINDCYKVKRWDEKKEFAIYLIYKLCYNVKE